MHVCAISFNYGCAVSVAEIGFCRRQAEGAHNAACFFANVCHGHGPTRYCKRDQKLSWFEVREEVMCVDDVDKLTVFIFILFYLVCFKYLYHVAVFPWVDICSGVGFTFNSICYMVWIGPNHSLWSACTLANFAPNFSFLFLWLTSELQFLLNTVVAMLVENFVWSLGQMSKF